ncbi:rRNA maturation RNase YbeY [Alkalihalobacillus oceani]|uniref:rRNA maturation RNase YbeY n=1 Tax=Halalkalibacter oceani TaxID=1653776 RepID=UPI00203E2E01|nr:rRNA maturation RNase YbeY [Halalkalibacter oceani]MCM3761501.1 rRNA maturation RNase YbeY [Halalkalibacter oceani]
MKLTVDINDETATITEVQQNLVKELLAKTAELEKVEGETEVSVTFVSLDRIQEINRDYRGKDQPTDVISFALNEQDEEELDVVAEGLPNVLGDIIISVSHIRSQAEEYGHSFERELGFLTVHGMLHLLGYDHLNEDEEKEMFSRQEDILSAYGLSR